MSNLRDANIFQDFTVWINDVGKIGEAPGFQPPELNIQTEEFRGGGMDGTVDIPMGIEKIEFDFDLHTYDQQIFEMLGYGPGSLDVPVWFRGYLLTAGGAERGVVIETRSLIKSIKPGKVQAGSKFEMSVTCSANFYRHKIDDQVINEIDVFAKRMIIGGVDRTSNARRHLGLTY